MKALFALPVLLALFAIPKERGKFGMNYGLAQGVLGDEVTLLVSLELVKPK